jgi:hypothetical protein
MFEIQTINEYNKLQLKRVAAVHARDSNNRRNFLYLIKNSHAVNKNR